MGSRFVLYNGSVYREERNIFKNCDCFVTRFKEKTDDSFYEYLDFLDSYGRDFEKDDVYDLYSVNFLIMYNDPNMPARKDKDDEDDKDEGKWWCVNETGTYRQPVNIENDEVSIAFYGRDYGIDVDEDSDKIPEGWEALKTQPAGFSLHGWIAKTLNIHDCEKLCVEYRYNCIGGSYSVPPDKRVKSVIMTPEEFKAEMLKYRLSNI